MQKEHYKRAGESLERVTLDEFVDEGSMVIHIVLPNDSEHFIAVSGEPEALGFIVLEGLLHITDFTELGGDSAVRTYGSWIFVEEIPYRKPRGSKVTFA